MNENQYSISHFPPDVDFDTPPVLKLVAEARGLLGELKGSAKRLPNSDILLSALFIQEALASSAIENIVTTQDEAFRARNFSGDSSTAAKEVSRYCDAMYLGFNEWKSRGFISENMLIEMFRVLKMSREGYRKNPVVIANPRTKEVIYRPPQDTQEVISLMRKLESFINEEAKPDDLDPVVKMALIHHQFESIHPFSDGNGRIGRVLNVLYLTHKGLLDSPILYLSRSINRTRPEYYRLLQAVGTAGVWEEWVVYILKAVVDSARTTLKLVEKINDLMVDYERDMRRHLKVPVQDLLNSLFFNPYTRIDYVSENLGVGRVTAGKYLKLLSEHKFVEEMKIGRSNYYINRKLIDLLMSVSDGA